MLIPVKDKEISFLDQDFQQIFRRLIETIKCAVFMADAKGELFYVNQSFIDVLEHNSKIDVLGKDVYRELFTELSDVSFFINQMKKTGFVREFEVQKVLKYGQKLSLSITANYIYNKSGEIMGIEGIAHDVTANRRLQNSVVAERDKLDQILGFDKKIGSIRKFDCLIDFIVEKITNILGAEKCSLMLLDEEKRELCIKASKGLDEKIIRDCRLTIGEGIAGSVALKQKAILVKNIEYSKEFKRTNRSNLKSTSFMIAPIKLENQLIGVINVSEKKGSVATERVFNEVDLKILNGMARDVAVAIENLKLYKELKFLTITDPLTHIYNYRQFSSSLDYEIKRFRRAGGNFCLIMLDIDHFKQYNDDFGHLEGDNLLIELGKILKDNIRETDMACRYAGDEFVIILPATDIAGAKKLAYKVKSVIEAFQFLQKVTVSVGVGLYTEKMTRYEIILKADQALYEAKKSGRNRVCAFG